MMMINGDFRMRCGAGLAWPGTAPLTMPLPASAPTAAC